MKAYITCPVTNSKKRLDMLPKIKEVLDPIGISSFVFRKGGDPGDIFARDLEQLESCDLIIAEVSEPSHGVGIELGISYCQGKKRILLLEKGTKLSGLAEGMPGTIIIEYSDIKEMKSELSREMEKLI